MIVHDGVVQYLAVEAPGQFEVSRAERVLEQL
jgi:peroxiredoxin